MSNLIKRHDILSLERPISLTTFQSPFTRVTACHVATYYYVGFCYIMLRRYPDAIRTFVTVLNFIMRMRQYHTRSYQYDQVCLYPP
jgi:hypothetical protein